LRNWCSQSAGRRCSEPGSSGHAASSAPAARPAGRWTAAGRRPGARGRRRTPPESTSQRPPTTLAPTGPRGQRPRRSRAQPRRQWTLPSPVDPSAQRLGTLGRPGGPEPGARQSSPASRHPSRWAGRSCPGGCRGASRTGPRWCGGGGGGGRWPTQRRPVRRATDAVQHQHLAGHPEHGLGRGGQRLTTTSHPSASRPPGCDR
jgi:hypothetical protein